MTALSLASGGFPAEYAVGAGEDDDVQPPEFLESHLADMRLRGLSEEATIYARRCAIARLGEWPALPPAGPPAPRAPRPPATPRPPAPPLPSRPTAPIPSSKPGRTSPRPRPG